MKALYIPISSLNFNSIFASESISPAGFYPKRNFGYKTFEKIVELNHFDNSIIAFDKFPIFEVKADGRDNYPMIIEVEVEVDVQPIKSFVDVAVYQSAETIYLNPFTTKVYFLSEEAKMITLLGSERSLSTKMVTLYEKSLCFSVLNKESNVSTFQFKTDLINGVKDISDNEIGKYIDIDQRKNKAKGFLYSYLLGANKSLSKELIIIKKTTREISNIISAIINSPDKSPTQFQKEDLLKNAEVFNTAFKNIDKDSIETEKLLNRYGNELSVSNIKKILRDTYLINKIENLFNIFNIVSSELNFETAISKIHNNTNRLENEYFANKSRLKLSEKVNLANIKLTRLEEDKPDFYMALINEFISFDLQNESRLDIATAGIKLLIRMYEEKNIPWNPSPQRDFFNGLLANMQGKGVFNVNNSNDIVHQSFALFVLHKEKDELEKLEAALIANTIYEYRFAFGLWGAINGFANMPKTLTNELFLSDDINYVSEAYKYIHKQVHSIELDGELKRVNDSKFASYPSKINERPTQVSVIESQNINPFAHELSTFVEFSSKDKTFQKEIISKLNEIGIKSLAEWNDKAVDTIKWSTSKGQKKLMTAISKSRSNEKQKEQSKPQQEKISYASNPDKDFYKDLNVYDLIEDLLPTDKKIKKQFKIDLDWFQGNYQEFFEDKKNGKQKGRYFGNRTDNYSVIEKFQDYLKNKKNSKEDWLRKIYSSIDTDQIMIKLKDLYS